MNFCPYDLRLYRTDSYTIPDESFLISCWSVVRKRYPAAHYVMIDDKPNLLASMKSAMGGKLTTVFVRQGHYALAAGSNSVQPPPDRVIERIGDLGTLDWADFGVRP